MKSIMQAILICCAFCSINSTWARHAHTPPCNDETMEEAVEREKEKEKNDSDHHHHHKPG